MRLSLLLLCLVAGFSSLAWSEPKRANFTIAFQDVETDLKLITTSVMPEYILTVDTVAEARAEQGDLWRATDSWHWQAPQVPGYYAIDFHHGAEAITLQVFVLTPFSNGAQEAIEGFQIGSYESELYRGLVAYAAPQGFVNPALGPPDLRVSPSFSIDQFFSKQQPEHDSTYLLILPAMLIKLETLLEAANENGWNAPTLHVMSGFRTPFYNRALGNVTKTSRHLYGGAADVWIDADGDGLMDDLNRDGRVDRTDAVTLASLAESLAARGGRNWPPGGMGIYDATPYHGPFVHIDTRGYQARW